MIFYLKHMSCSYLVYLVTYNPDPYLPDVLIDHGSLHRHTVKPPTSLISSSYPRESWYQQIVNNSWSNKAYIMHNVLAGSAKITFKLHLRVTCHTFIPLPVKGLFHPQILYYYTSLQFHVESNVNYLCTFNYGSLPFTLLFL